MKKLFSAILCLVFVFTMMQLPVSAVSESTPEEDNSNSPRLSYIYDANVSIGKSGDYVLVTGQLSCRKNLVSLCSINVSLYSRVKGSSSAWRHEGTSVRSGDYYCSGMRQVAADSTKEYRGRIYCTARLADGTVLETLTLYTDVYRP